MDSAFVTHRRVEFRDTDAAGIMHFSTYFTYMEEVEHEFLRSLGTSVVLPDSDSGTISWPRVAAECEYQGTASFEEELAIELSISKIGRSSVTYEFRFHAHNQLIATGRVTTVCCRIVPGQAPQSRPIPEALRRLLSHHLAQPHDA